MKINKLTQNQKSKAKLWYLEDKKGNIVYKDEYSSKRDTSSYESNLEWDNDRIERYTKEREKWEQNPDLVILRDDDETLEEKLARLDRYVESSTISAKYYEDKIKLLTNPDYKWVCYKPHKFSAFLRFKETEGLSHGRTAFIFHVDGNEDVRFRMTSNNYAVFIKSIENGLIVLSARGFYAEYSIDHNGISIVIPKEEE